MYVLLYLILLGMLSEANLPVDETYCLLVIDQLIFPLQVLGGLGGHGVRSQGETNVL